MSDLRNPIDILGSDPTGAHAKPEDRRDYLVGVGEVGAAPAAFDWAEGYDVEDELSAILGKPFKLPTKNQANSSSCGGQTVAEYAQAILAASLKDTSERSAKAPYSQVFVPGGGSNSRRLGDIYVKQGVYSELLVPSYENGAPPSEAFMTRPQDISAAARTEALKTAGMLAYAYPKQDIDAIASAIKANKGLLIGIHGSNNGTWLSTAPAVRQEGAFWAHFMYAGKAKLYKGRRGIWAKQSWGAAVSPTTDAWQFISEEHFAAGRIWDAMAFIFNPKPTKPVHVFQRDIRYGEESAEVYTLQQTLAADGVFNLAPTGKYYDITAASVLKFRAKHGVDTSTDPTGHIVGTRTRAALNALPAH